VVLFKSNLSILVDRENGEKIMFNNIGGKIKVLATVIAVLGICGSFICGKNAPVVAAR